MVEKSGFLFPVRFSWAAAGILVCVAITVATGAGLWPALRTLRVRITETIAYELPHVAREQDA